MNKVHKETFENFEDAFGKVQDTLKLKTDEKNLRVALKILDFIRKSGDDVSIRTALNILEDAGTVLLEMTRF